jgi:hypothetical protein
MLRKGGTISHPDLPFDVEINRYMTNSVLRRSPTDHDLLVAEPQSDASGVESEEDIPSGYLTLRDKQDGSVLARDYLVSVYLSPEEARDGRRVGVATVAGEERVAIVPYTPVKANGKEYEVSLRFKRTYRPFHVHLIDFRFDRYMGTDIARNFSSEVRVIDPEKNEDRQVVIRMNEPLMYRGETFYQANFDKTTERTTVLQVVRNPGWALPYISCIVVAVGMLMHFGINLVGFLNRRAAA